jgi:hypothetical protein
VLLSSIFFIADSVVSGYLHRLHAKSLDNHRSIHLHTHTIQHLTSYTPSI